MVKIHRDGFSGVASGDKSRDGSECQPIVNIIFIHGLGGHPRETWEAPLGVTQKDDTGGAHKNHRSLPSIFRSKKAQSKSVCDETSSNSREEQLRSDQTIFWIEDFLPQDTPNAKILTYGYNADVIGGLFQANNKNSISHHGRDLTARLERDLENDAPIIFVAHSLGGIIAKDALHRSKSARQRTKLIVFLGTPHRGSYSAHWGQIASNMARLTLQDSNKKLLETLEVNSEVLDNIQEEFKAIVSEGSIRVHSFQEARGISGMKGLHNKVVDDFSSKVDLASTQETVETIDANHMQMTKYSSRDDPGYRAVSGVLKAFIGRQLKAKEVEPTKISLPSSAILQNNTTAASTARVHFMVPFQRNGDLIGREMIIQSLETKLCVPNKYCRVALVGLGGIGKTRIALEYASKFEKSDSVSVFWVHSSTAEQMEKAYQEIAKEARLFGAEDPKVDQLLLVKGWLESEASGSWVMIIDNADDEKLFFGEDEGHADNDLTELVEILENLPLALVQAAAFIQENSQSIGEYLRTYRRSDSSKTKLLSQNFEDSERHPGSKNPVAATWAISFEQIRRNNHRAADLLSLMGVLDMQAIPKSLLSSDKEDVEFEKALGTLKAFSLITPEQSHQAFNLHRLVYLATCNWMKMNEELESWTRKALVLLSELFPRATYGNREIWTAYLPHARIVLNSNHLPASEDIAQATLLYSVSVAFQQKGDYDPAEVMAQKSLDLREKVLGEKHADTLHSLSNLGTVFWKQSKNEKAEKIHRRALNGFKEMLGKEDLHSLRGLNRLGLVLADQGKYEEAEKLHRQALSAREKILGNEHADTLRSVNNLALVLGKQGKYGEAKNLHGQALSAREETLGKEHPDTLDSVNCLAIVLDQQGKYEAAEKLHRRALSAREKIFGNEHPATLRSVNNLALVLVNQGKYEEAEIFHRRALSVKEKILGKEHPSTLLSVSNLGLALDNQGKYHESEKMHRQALSAKEKILGNEHPDTLGSVNNLALVLRKQGQVEEAITLYQRALGGREKSLGKQHPDTFHSIWSLAYLFQQRCQYQDALPLYQRACAGLEKTLGSDHPWTQDCVRNYSRMLDEMKKNSETEIASVIDTGS